MEPSIKGEVLALPSEHPSNQGLETWLSTWTEPCINVWPFDRQLGVCSCYPRGSMTKEAQHPYTKQWLLFGELTPDHRKRERAQRIALSLNTLKAW